MSPRFSVNSLAYVDDGSTARRKANELGPLISRLTSPGLHFVGGVAGLALEVTPAGTRSWVLRVQVGSKRCDMGLGGFPDVTLAGAREGSA